MTDQPVTIGNRVRANLTGSTAGSGYVGGNVTGAPGSGAHLTGDFAIDQGGTIWVCTASGTPGTWQRCADYLKGQGNTWTGTQAFGAITATTGVFSGDVDATTFEATGAASLGSAQSGRFVGSWTVLGPPTGLTAEVADYGFDNNGNMWVCTAAGTPGTWKPRGVHLLDYQTPSGVSSITLGPNPLPSGYDWLEIVWQVRETGVAGTDFLKLLFNNDSGSNYYRERIGANGTSLGATELLTQTSAEVGVITGSSVADAALPGMGTVRIYNYTGTTFKKYWLATGFCSTGLTTGLEQLFMHGGVWNSTAAVTRLDASVANGNFVAGSWIKLLGGVL
jgi:hypothetical protein